MKPVNLKITDLIPKSTVCVSKRLAGLFTLNFPTDSFRSSRLVRLARRPFPVWGFLFVLLVTICVVGSLGCQRGEQAGGASKVRQGKVIGGSMAPNFLGEHFLFQCKQCESEVVTDYAQSIERDALVCPFCGASQQRSDCRRQNSDRVEIELVSPAIKRWDVVAFQVPGASEAGIKRVVGMPGEAIEIRDGNLWRDGKLLQKSLEDQKRVRILVHDSQNSDPEGHSWQAVDSAGVKLDQAKHRFADREFGFDFQADDSEVQWFRFRNQRNYAHQADPNEADAWPIEDHYGYNQSLSRQLNVVDEFFVSIEVFPIALKRIGWKFNRGGNTYEFEIDKERAELTVLKFGEGEIKTTVKFDLSDGLLKKSKTEIEFSTIDQRAVLFVGGVKVTEFELDSVTGDNQRTEQLIQIGADLIPSSNQSSPVGRVRIWRDIYYLPAQLDDAFQTLSGSSGGYLLLGDNQPVSIDSRHWPDASVPRGGLIGRVRKEGE